MPTFLVPLNDGVKRNRFPYLKIITTPIDSLVFNLRQTGVQKYIHAKKDKLQLQI